MGINSLLHFLCCEISSLIRLNTLQNAMMVDKDFCEFTDGDASKKFKSRKIHGFPRGSVVKNPPAMQETCGRRGINPRVGKILWSKKWQPTPVYLPGKSHGQRSQVGYSSWGHKESGTTEWLNNTNPHPEGVSFFQHKWISAHFMMVSIINLLSVSWLAWPPGE